MARVTGIITYMHGIVRAVFDYNICNFCFNNRINTFNAKNFSRIQSESIVAGYYRTVILDTAITAALAVLHL